MPENPNNLKDHLLSLHQDAVSWKARRLWIAATDPDEQAVAIEHIVDMLICISNEVKRSGYIKTITTNISNEAKQLDIEKKKLQAVLSVLEKKVSKLQNKKSRSEDDDQELQRTLQQLMVQKELEKESASRNVSVLTESLLKKSVTDRLKDIETKRQAEIVRKKLEAQFTNAEEAGLPANFKGKLEDALKYAIYEHEGVYYSRGQKGDYPVSNFTMRILYHVDTSDEQAFRLIAVKNVYGFESFINLNTDDFVSLGAFKKVLARRGDYIFKGTDSDLSRLQELLQKDEVKTVYVKTLGWHKRGKFYGFANGIYCTENYSFIPTDEYGMIHHKSKTWFIPAVSKMYAEKDDQFVNEKKFIYREPVLNFGFKEWAALFYKTYGEKSMPAILFYIGSLFRDIIMKQIQRYPILCLFGPPGAGKGQMAESMMCMFGERQDQIMLGGASTVVGFMRKFAQFANAIVWLDEYKNNLPMKFIESFKNIYDGKGYERGKMTNDFTTESTPIHSSCILSGQDMPTIEPALFMRTILLSFEDGKFTPEQRQSFQELKDLEASGLSYITAQLLRYRELIDKDFKEKQLLLFKQLIREVANVEVDDRMILNISILLTFHDLLLHHIDLPFTFKEAKEWMIDNMLHQHTILAGNNDVAKFWSVVESLFHQEIIHEGRDFELKDGYIFLCLSKVHPHYLKEMRMRGDMNFLSKPTMEHYLQLDKTIFVGHKKMRFADGSNNYVYQMKYAKLKIDLIKLKNSGQTEEQAAFQMEMKLREMETPLPPVGGDVEDAPFGEWRASEGI